MVLRIVEPDQVTCVPRHSTPVVQSEINAGQSTCRHYAHTCIGKVIKQFAETGVVAEKQQQVVGMCSAQLLISTAEGGWKAIIEDVVVAKQLRGQGIGKRMLDELADWAGLQGASRKDLLADRDNIDGLKFYDRLNWRRTNLIALQLK